MHVSDKGHIQNLFHGLLSLGATAHKETHWSLLNFQGGQQITKLIKK